MNFEIVSRAEARAKGLKRYFTGRPCTRGHTVERQTSNKNCVECRQANREGYRQAEIDYSRRWRSDNRVRHQQYSAAYRAANPDRVKSGKAEWRKKNHEVVRQSLRMWQQANPAKLRFYEARRRARLLQAVLPGFDEEITAIYAACPPGWHVDHIIPLKGKAVCGLHVPWNLQYLEPSPNSEKGNRFDPSRWPEQGQLG